MPQTSLSPINRLLRRLQLPARRAHGERFLRLAAEARARVREIPPREAAQAVESGAFLVDVRERGEFNQRHIAGAEPLARGVLDLEIEAFAPDPATPIICYCGAGARSALAADTLLRMGYTDVRTIRGGIIAWIAAGLPTGSEREALD